jgi:hypothetical protein
MSVFSDADQRVVRPPGIVTLTSTAQGSEFTCFTHCR